MSTKSIMIAAAAAFATLAGGIGAANAHGHGNHFFFNQHHGLRIIGRRLRIRVRQLRLPFQQMAI